MTKKIFGGFFQKLTGKSVEEFTTLESVNGAIEEKRNKKTHASTYKSSVVHGRGNVFKYSRHDDLDKRIDNYLTR